MINIDRYKQLKQCLVIFEALFLKSVVKVDNVEIDLEKLKINILSIIDGIEKDMTIPVSLLQTKRASLDIWDLERVFSKALQAVTDNENFGSYTVEEKLNDYPNFKLLVDGFYSEKERNIVYEDLKRPTVKLLGDVEEAIGFIIMFVSRRELHPNLKLIDMLNLVNLIHTVEFVFELTNEHS